MTALQSPRQTGQRTSRPQLQAVPPRRRRDTAISFVVVMALLLAAGMVGLLVLTTALQSKAIETQQKQREATALEIKVSSLQSALAQARSIKHLAVVAQSLGMKPDPYGTQLRLSDGGVLGMTSR